jgi:hypothetical protein
MFSNFAPWPNAIKESKLAHREFSLCGMFEREQMRPPSFRLNTIPSNLPLQLRAHTGVTQLSSL